MLGQSYCLAKFQQYRKQGEQVGGKDWFLCGLFCCCFPQACAVNHLELINPFGTAFCYVSLAEFCSFYFIFQCKSHFLLK